MEQASRAVQALGRKADTIAQAPLSHSELTAPSTSRHPRSRRANSPLCRGAAATHHHGGLGWEAAGQQPATEKTGLLSQSLGSTLLHRGKSQEQPILPRTARCALPFLTPAPSPRRSSAWCGNLPQNTLFSLHFLPLQAPGTSSRTLLPPVTVTQARTYFPVQRLIVCETKTITRIAQGCCSDTFGDNTIRMEGLVPTADDKQLQQK